MKYFQRKKIKKLINFLTWVTLKLKKKRQLFIKVILKLLKKKIKVKKKNIQSYFTFVQEQCLWFPQEGTVNLAIWEKIEKQLRDDCAQHGPEKIPTNTFSL